MASRSGEQSSEVAVNRADEADVPEKPDDPRVVAIGRIWRMIIPVVALSIPICTLSRLGIFLPFLAVASAGVGTVCVWMFGGKRERVEGRENERLHARIKELEERLANVETISHFEMQLAAREKTALSAQAQPTSQAQPVKEEGA
jgi:hypothetical protein